MKPHECQFEAEVLASVIEGRWPELIQPDLRSHIDTCPICSDLAIAASAINAAAKDLNREAPVPDSARVWWQLQMRARRDAAEAACRPIAAAETIALACVIALLIVCISATIAWLPLVAPGLWAQHSALIIVGAAIFFLVPAGVVAAVVRE